ncbi:bifunctional DNA primase/polymerase [Gemmatimonas sp.]|jgi:hypothetical protein|uniref:bifunctional DNA primase/polymerase n=1 Tax=Gemmatimonas sp. TaxID=1962908 RepID=UPI0037BF1884
MNPALRTELAHRAAWAIGYARLGWPMLPTHGIGQDGTCTCGNRTCDRPGKHPARANYKAMATTDAATLRSYWALVLFNLSLRIPAGLVVLDVDDPAALRPLARFGAWPITPTHTTTRGLRMFFAWPGADAAPSLGGLDRTKLDVLGTDDLCIVPPSTSATGHRYTWRAGEDPWTCPLAPVPEAFAEHCRRMAAARARARTHTSNGPADTLEGAVALARRRARYAGFTSNGAGRGAAGLRRALTEAGAAPAVIAAALDTFHAEAGR